MGLLVLPVFNGVIIDGHPIYILIVVDTGYAGIHHSKYWIPIYCNTIADG